MPKHNDLTGKRFGRLTVTEKTKENGFWHYVCKCDCGNEKKIISGALTRKIKPTRSCGCLQKEAMKTGRDNPAYRHGHCKNGKRSATLSIWTGMMRRCYEENCKSYKDYGGRGIKVCSRWHEFKNFLEDMGERPPNLTIERIDNFGNYAPGNCKWIPKAEQNVNQRSNRVVEINGIKKPLVVWCRDLKLNYYTVHSRITKLKWEVSEALELQDAKVRNG